MQALIKQQGALDEKYPPNGVILCSSWAVSVNHRLAARPLPINVDSVEENFRFSDFYSPVMNNMETLG